MWTSNRSQVSARLAVVTSMVVVLGALTSCAGASVPGSESASETSAAETVSSPQPETENTTDDPFGAPDAAWQCGYVSSLGGMVSRASFQFETGEINEVSYSTRLSAIQDAWANFPPGESTVSAPLAAAITSAASGLVDNPDFDDAMTEVTLACNEAGSLVAAKLLPGQGG